MLIIDDADRQNIIDSGKTPLKVILNINMTVRFRLVVIFSTELRLRSGVFTGVPFIDVKCKDGSCIFVTDIYVNDLPFRVIIEAKLLALSCI